MSVVSYLFLVFLLITTAVYYIIPGKIRWVVLLIASLLFYAYSSVEYLYLVCGTAMFVYLISLLMQRNLDKQATMLVDADRKEARKIKKDMKKKRKRVLLLGFVGVIGLLIYFKGGSFILENVNIILDKVGKEPIPVWSIIAPLGISFYSFMMISYLMEIYNDHISAQKNPLKYLTYVLYFPHVTQGPIARYDETGPQIFGVNKFDHNNLVKGWCLIAWGFFKKLVIADRIAPLVTTVFGNSSDYAGPIFLFVGVLYSIQIYCDFSGCMDIVRGASECFGIRLTENFQRPYFSQTLPEFWRRWHISLGAFFREYIFYPVSTSSLFLKLNTKGRKLFGNEWGRNIASCLPILCVWILTGIWHGANWNYIGWGLYHGILICLSTLFEHPIHKLCTAVHLRTENFSWSVFRMLRTFFLCVIGRIIFMGNSLADSFYMIRSGFCDIHEKFLLSDFSLSTRDWQVLALSCLFLLIISIAQEIRSKVGAKGEIRDWLVEQNFWFRWAVVITGVLVIICFGVYGSGAGTVFIYEQF